MEVTIAISLVFSSLLTVGNLEDRLNRLLATHGLVVRVALILGMQVRLFAFAEGLLRYLSTGRVMKRWVLTEVCELARASVLVLPSLHFILSKDMVLQILLVLVICSESIDAHLDRLDSFKEFIESRSIDFCV